MLPRGFGRRPAERAGVGTRSPGRLSPHGAQLSLQLSSAESRDVSKIRGSFL